MKKNCVVLMLYFFSGLVHAVTVTSVFEITNRATDKVDFSSTDATATFTDTGNELYRISDKYQDANINASQYGNNQIALQRTSSTVKFVMKGDRLGHTFELLGKYANSSISIPDFNQRYHPTSSNNGCSKVSPLSDPGLAAGSTIVYQIFSSSDVSKNCVGKTGDYNMQPTGGVIRVTGVQRDFYLDIGRMKTSSDYRKAPPDTYRASGTFQGERIVPRVGNGFTPSYINNITVVKNPYFDSVTLPSGDNLFDTRTVGGKIQGNVVVPYVINGHFTPYNTLSLQVSSLNGFKLQSSTGGSTASIPYSLSTTISSQRVYPLAITGTGSGTVTISNLDAESYAIQGRFDADFLIDKNTAITGSYSDTLTALFQIAL